MIDLHYLASRCKDFVDESGRTREVERVVMPLRIIEGKNYEGDRKFNILTGCSHYKSCQNEKCSFALVSRESAKERGELNG